jgi:hypothetical protein
MSIKKSRMFILNFILISAVVLAVGCSGSKKKGDASDTTPPADVTALAGVQTSTSVALSWTPPSDSDFAGVIITFTPVVTGISQPITVPAGTNSYTVSGLASGTNYIFMVNAVDNSENVSVGASVTVKTTGSLAATTLYLVGDSTVCSFSPLDKFWYPRYGYGTQLGTYLDSAVTINNLALSGRSSRNYATDTTDASAVANYATFKSAIKKGDYVMIGFGHNDEKAGTFYSNPNGAVTDNTSFKYYLYTYYIKVALDAGATPILCTPTVRRDSSGVYADKSSSVHYTADVTSGGVLYPGGDYPQAIRDLGTALGVTVIDNTILTRDLHRSTFTASAAAGTANFMAWTYNSINSTDDTHTNIYGAAYYAYLITNALLTSNCSLKDYVKSGNAAPVLATILVGDPLYASPPAATVPTSKSIIWTTTDPWWGSVFGDVTTIGTTNYDISEKTGGVVSMRSGTGTAAGKIAAASDGIAFYFQIVPIAKDFTFTATATVNSITANDQVSFGIMVRDGVWIDLLSSSLTTNYVACGVRNATKGVAAMSSWQRDTSATTQLSGTAVSSTSVIPVAGTVVNLKIVKAGSAYTVTYGTEAPVTYTLDLGKSEPLNVYPGLYTARQCQVDFSNIVLTIQ